MSGLKSLFYVSLGLLAGRHFFVVLKDATGIQQLCFKDLSTAPSSFGLGINGVDNFLCILADFFKNVMFKTGVYGVAVSALLLSVFAPVIFMASVESSRKGANFLTQNIGLVILISQFLGLGLIFPLLWMSSYVWTDKGDNARSQFVSKLSVNLSALVTCVLTLTMVPLYFSPKEHLELMITGFVLAPVFGFVLNINHLINGYPANAKNAINGSKLALNYFYAFAGVSSFVWLGILSYIWQNWSQFANLESLRYYLTENQYTSFLFVDGLTLMVSSSTLILFEQGLTQLVYFKFRSIFVGPGAALMLYCAEKEEVYLTRLERLSNKEKTS